MYSISTNIAELSFDEKNAVLYMTIIENAEMTMENTKDHYEKIEKITQNKKYAALIDMSNYYITSPEILSLTAQKSTFKNRIATIYYNSSMSNKLTNEFFKNNYKPEMVIKTFKTKAEGLKWWLEVKDEMLNITR
ncbi:MAG: hypothetical protein H0W73_18830 [Bacteroidetes bacterium]|nr:hypothetical protein [Bacteroidota bacterium]